MFEEVRLFDLGMKTRTKKCVYIGFLTVSKEKQMHLVASCSYLGVNDKLLKQIVSTYARTHHWISKSNRTRLRAYWGRTIQLISNDHKYFFFVRKMRNLTQFRTIKKETDHQKNTTPGSLPSLPIKSIWL